MAKRYTKNTWQDEVLEDSEFFNILNSEETPLYEDVIIVLATGVTQEGTKLDAEIMNNIEDGIDTLDDALLADEALIDQLAVLSAVRIYTSNDTWTRPDNLAYVIVEVIGAGGGGGGVVAESNKTAVGGGGGPGGYAKKFLTIDSLTNETETVTVGAKGNKGEAGNNNGSAGGTSSFGAHASATGGSGGSGQAAFSTVPRRGGSCGSSGAGSGGDINAAGGIGAVGANLAVTASGLIGGGGGNSIYGAGGAQRTSEGAGPDGSGYGAGGGGACSVNSTTNLAGGDGTGGLVIVWEYIKAEEA